METAYIARIPELFSQEGTCLHQGRNIVKRLHLPDGQTVIVKRFKRPSWIQRITIPFRGSKAERAFLHAARLLALGFHTPEPLCYLKDKRGCFYLITTEDKGRPLCEAFHDKASCQDFAKAFADYTYELHCSGVIHKDYNSTNVRFRINGSRTNYLFSLIDVNRMAFYPDMPPLRRRLENLFDFGPCDELFRQVLRHYLTRAGICQDDLFRRTVARKQLHDRRSGRKRAVTKCLKRLLKR